MKRIELLARRVFVGGRELPPLPRRPSKVLEAEVPPGRRLRAGAAKVDVTPSGPVTIRGFTPRTSTGVHRNLYVRALVLDDGEEKLAVLSWEKLNLYHTPDGFERVADLRERIRELIGIPPENVLINASHTHSGCEGPFEEASVEAVELAWRNMREARIGAGSKMIYGIGSNRRLPDGTGLWGCNQPNPEGIMDNECGVVRIEDMQRKILAVLINYSAHPSVLDANNTLLSGDYAGVAMAEVEDALEGSVALFLQGCAGDTGTHTFRRKRSISEAERLGRKLAKEVVGIVKHIDVLPWVPLKAKSKFIELPRKGGNGIKDEIQVMAMDDCAIACVGSMEAYVDIGLKVKQASPFKHTFTVAYSNGPWLGYLPSEHGFAVNDPDARETPFAPDAVKVLIFECTELLKEVRAEL